MIKLDYFRSSLFAIISLLIVCQAAKSSDLGSSWHDAKSDLYSKEIQSLYDAWSSEKKNLKIAGQKKPLYLQAVPTPDNDSYIGIMAEITIDASVDKVLEVLRDYDNYQTLYPDIQSLKVVNRSEGSEILDWDFKGPLGTHTKYQTVQTVKKLGAIRGAQLYRLRSSKDVTASDGIIFLQEVEGITSFVSFDFFNADWGMLAKLFKNKIWTETCLSTAKSTFTIKVLAERLKTKDPHKKVDLESKELGYSGETVEQHCSQMENRKKQKVFEKLQTEILE